MDLAWCPLFIVLYSSFYCVRAVTESHSLCLLHLTTKLVGRTCASGQVTILDTMSISGTLYSSGFEALRRS